MDQEGGGAEDPLVSESSGGVLLEGGAMMSSRRQLNSLQNDTPGNRNQQINPPIGLPGTRCSTQLPT